MFILVGNIISFIAALFMIASCLMKKREGVYGLQFVQCTLLSISSWFLNSYSGIISNFISGLQNLFAAKGLFTKRIMLLFLGIAVIMGTTVNNRGIIGLMPISANVLYAVCCYKLKRISDIKVGISINLIIWVIYSLCILDFPTAVSDGLAFVLNTIAVFKLKNE